ncbi:hypothetical protein [Desulfosediminicola ganghwensis]|uniref:hypothetical protein n=1 Tax=Desulfosediminicola ganghwensis TaxID=2569540 RepID=UPI0012946F28|nr:hypothetical protein [Desulfosediminicola ganghwensis]
MAAFSNNEKKTVRRCLIKNTRTRYPRLRQSSRRRKSPCARRGHHHVPTGLRRVWDRFFPAHRSREYNS